MVIAAIFAVFIAFLFYMVLNRRRKNPALNQSFPPEWKSILQDKVSFYRKLEIDNKKLFEQKVRNFLAECRITGVDTIINDTDRLLVAASAVIPIFEFPDWHYHGLKEVLLYPGSFNQKFETANTDQNISGMVGWGFMNHTMVLSKPALHQGFENEAGKENVGIHEFVHLLDKTDGAVDGIPEILMEKQYAIPWMILIHDEMNRINQHHSDINPYATFNEAEFFSVASEYFFKQPQLLAKKHPDLYNALELIFHKNTADQKKENSKS